MRRDEYISNTLTILHGMAPEETKDRKHKNRADFEELLQKQGHYLPGETELKRWFGSETPATHIRQVAR